MSGMARDEPERRKPPRQKSKLAKDAEKRVNETCALCVESCKQGPECIVVTCPQFKKKDEDPKVGSRSSRPARPAR